MATFGFYRGSVLINGRDFSLTELYAFTHEYLDPDKTYDIDWDAVDPFHLDDFDLFADYPHDTIFDVDFHEIPHVVRKLILTTPCYHINIIPQPKRIRKDK